MRPRVRPVGYRLTSEVGLNHTHPELRVNVLEYWEIDAKGKGRHWSGITNLELRRDNAEALMHAWAEPTRQRFDLPPLDTS